MRGRDVGRRVAVAATAVGIALAAGLAVPTIAGATAPDQDTPAAYPTSKDPKKDDGEYPRFATEEDATIVPGVALMTPPVNGLFCTANYVYTSGNRVLLGTAAHCVQPRETAGGSGVNGCERPSLPLGTRVGIQGTDLEVTEGTLAYSSWLTMQARGETDQSLCEFNDMALIEIDPADVGLVNPTVPILGGPNGLDSDGSDPGETVFAYAPNIIPETPVKRGVSLGSDMPLVLGDGAIPSDGRVHQVKTTPDGIPGDSGSPYLDGDGEALGLLSFGIVTPTGTVVENGVTDLAKALAYAGENGDLGKIALVPGTAPFTTGGLPLLDLPALPDFPDLTGRDLSIRGMS